MPLFPASRPPLRAAIPALCLCLSLLLPLQAVRAQTTNPSKVRIIYLIPSDKTERADYMQAMENAIRHLQRWYWVQMEGKTFTLNDPVVEVVKTIHPSSYYGSHASGDFSLWFWNNVIADGFAAKNAGFNDPLNRWIFYIDAEPQSGQIGGAGTSGVSTLPQHDLMGLIGKVPAEPRMSRWVGGLGHELGHAFGLPHPAVCDSHEAQDASPTCQSLMYLGYIPYPVTRFLPSDMETLNASAFFTEQRLTQPPVESGNLLGTAVSGSGDGLNAAYFNTTDFTGDAVSRVDPWIALDGLWGPPAPGIEPTSFSVRWTGLIQALRTEDTRFKLVVDGGVRLRVKDQLIVDQWKDSGSRTWTGHLPLTAHEKVPITLEYFSDTGVPKIKLLWSGPGTREDGVPQSQLYTAANRPPRAQPLRLVTPMNRAVGALLSAFDPDGEEVSFRVLEGPTHGALSGSAPRLIYTPETGYTGKDTFTYLASDGAHDGAPVTVALTILSLGAGTGLQGVYFNNRNLSGTGTPRTDSVVNFDWGGGAPMPSIGADNFSVRWTGYLMPQLTETYTFYTQTDDGVRLQVNGQLLVDKWVDQGTTEWSGNLPLEAGKEVPIRMEYYENGGGAIARLLWSSPSLPKGIIPRTQLIPALLPNHPPVAQDLALDTPRDVELEFLLSGADPDGDPLTWAVATSPTLGSLSGKLPALTYTPNPGVTGDDSFTYTASDGQAKSAPATVSIHVLHKNPPGDLNGDEMTNVQDAMLALQASVHLITLTPEQVARGDLAPPKGGDGRITVADAVAILQIIVGRETG